MWDLNSTPHQAPRCLAAKTWKHSAPKKALAREIPPATQTYDQAPVVRRVDNAIHRINHYPVDSVVCFPNTYPLDSDLSAG